MRQTQDRHLTVLEVWDRREFTRPNGTTGSVQKIRNENDHTLVIWDQEEFTNAKGNIYLATNVIVKENQNGYNEYHTTKNSEITQPTRATKERLFEDHALEPEVKQSAEAMEEILKFRAQLHDIKVELRDIKKMIEQLGELI
jgi:hypothetical protein